MEQTNSKRLAPGLLVRYLETTTRWYFAVVRTARPDELGRIEPDESESQDDAGDQESFAEAHERGQLTEEECRAVMLNLAPTPIEGRRPG